VAQCGSSGGARAGVRRGAKHGGAQVDGREQLREEYGGGVSLVLEQRRGGGEGKDGGEGFGSGLQGRRPGCQRDGGLQVGRPSLLLSPRMAYYLGHFSKRQERYHDPRN
jgi:hypothetical protein